MELNLANWEQETSENLTGLPKEVRFLQILAGPELIHPLPKGTLPAG